MAYSLTDDELRQKLELLGEEVGPVTPTTRRTLQKKLDAILKSNKRVLNSLSSDESEVERHFASDKNRKKRFNHRSLPTTPKFSLNEKKDVAFKKPLPTTPKHSPRADSKFSPDESKTSRSGGLRLRSRNSFDLEVSDSDTEALVSPMHGLKLRTRSSTGRNSNSSSEDYLKRTSLLSNGEDYSQTKSSSDWRLSSLQKIPTFRERKLPKDISSNGYLIGDAVNGIFPSRNSGRTTNYSLCISWMLVLATITLFLLLAFLYLSAVQKTNSSANKSYFDSLICIGNKSTGCIPDKHLNLALQTSHELHDLLSTVAGEYECQTRSDSRNLSFSSTKEHLKVKFDNHKVDSKISFDEIFEHAIWLSLKNPDWGISIFSNEGMQLTDDNLQPEILKSVGALESKHASKSLWCRVQSSIHWTITRLFLVFFVISALLIGALVFKYWKKRKDLQEKEFFELVENILDVLQSNDEGGSSSPGCSSPYKAVAHLRDRIIPLKDRRAKQQLWDKAVAFIEDNESRVQVDCEQISGENYKVWRWLPSPMSDSEEGKKGKVWQGQAFSNLSKGKKVPYCPTPCLKIRNMFDYEVEYGDDWQISIQDAILEKCEENDGILHIAVDHSSKESCVYMLCNSRESAGKAYNALHGWWFDGKLVTVKYLHIERYVQRYPQAKECHEPLKPSNNKRLSLSTPFFSSALERS